MAVDLAAAPSRCSPSGSTSIRRRGLARTAGMLAWLAWRHPNMPWDTNELWVAGVDDDGSLTDERMLAGGREESIVQPEWAPDGAWSSLSDRSGWWNLYRPAPPAGRRRAALTPMKAEFAGPQWVFGMRWYGIADDGTIVARGRWRGRRGCGSIPAGGRTSRRSRHTATRSLQVARWQVRSYIGAAVRPAARGRAATTSSERERRVLRASFELVVIDRRVSLRTTRRSSSRRRDGQTALTRSTTRPQIRASRARR